MQFVLASHNQKKLKELSTILNGLGIEVIPLPEDAPEPEENGKTFEENARIKALAAHQYTGLPAIADDSGLAVDALSGAPGVYSARYCSGSDADRNLFLLKNMEMWTNVNGRHDLCVQSAVFLPMDRKLLCVASVKERF